MNGIQQMDEWIDGWIDGWMNGLMDGWIDGWMDGWIDGWMDRWMDEWIINRQIERIFKIPTAFCFFMMSDSSVYGILGFSSHCEL